MSTVETVEWRRERMLLTLRRLSWLPLLLARVTVGVIFFAAGVEKLADLGKATAEFTHLGIAGASFFAPFVGVCELVAGALLIVGLLTRLATVPMIITMIVAILTAKLDHVHSLTGFLGLEETLLIVMLVTIALLGPGRASLDELLERRFLEGPAAPCLRRRARG